MLTKKQIYTIVKRTSHILDLLKRDENKKVLYIGKRKETVEINDDVLTVLSIEDEIIQSEESEWLKQVFSGIRAGEKDISLLSANPLARTKFYDVKKDFINRIYGCCIFKGLVPYEDILKGSSF